MKAEDIQTTALYAILKISRTSDNPYPNPNPNRLCRHIDTYYIALDLVQTVAVQSSCRANSFSKLGARLPRIFTSKN